MIDLRDATYFVAIAEAGNLALAAEKLGRTQPALTKCIQRLEEDLRTELFRHEGRRLALTEAGNVFYARMRNLLSYASEVRREISDLGTGIAGLVRIGSAATAAEYMLPPLTAELIAQAPAVTLELTVGMNDVLVRALVEKNLDLVFGPLTQFTRDTERFETFPLVDDDVVAVASHDHPIFDRPVAVDDLVKYKWVLSGRAVATRQWLENKFRSLGLEGPKVQMETSSISLLPRLIAETKLLSFISLRNLAPGAVGSQLREIPLAETRMRREFGIIRLREAYFTPAARLLVRIASGKTSELIDAEGPVPERMF
ncbi:LysR family transcriptional regulator [Neorhizobium sp. NCHU2750]|uniref:LysR family transcriptional regulator n=1 Tax=Neorhizobium sp. NCHU2750 TaxID=1825976 RepID=UPI000EB7506D|nr:LysR family transcriptional regulator [Neorhizobium sp. NCHU2750]